MKGNDKVIQTLNDVLTAELTSINQYFIHAKMCQNWGFTKLAKKVRDESIDEMKHADKLIERILFLDGIPNVQRLNKVNVGETDFVLLLAKEDEIEDGKLDTAKVKAFRVPAGAAVEVYGTTLHYAPCQTEKTGFRVAVVLPKGTNTEKPAFEPQSEEDTWMTARNKWLLAHPDSGEAKSGAHIGLTGKNIDITEN